MKKTATVKSGWVGDGKSPATAFRPAVLAEYPCARYQDRTGGAGGVGTVDAEVEVADAVLAAIKADLKYAGKVTEATADEAKVADGAARLKP